MAGANRPGMSGGPGNESDLMNIIPERLTREEASDEPKKGRNLLVAGALIGAAVAGAAGWFLVGGGTATDGLVAAPTIQANDSPFKVRPADPGGMQVPNQDKLVYERLTPDSGRSANVEQLLPEPRTPQPPPLEPRAPLNPQTADGGTPPPPPTAEVTAREAVIAAGGAIPSITAPADGQPEALSNNAAPAPAQTPVPAPVTVQATPEPQASASTQPEPVGIPEPAETVAAVQPAPPTPAPAVEPAPAAAPAPAPAVKGDYTIQLAALKDEASAMKAWQTLLRAQEDVLKGLSPVVQRADLKDKGIFYRLRATGFPSEAAARKACETLGQRKVGCLYIGK